MWKTRFALKATSLITPFDPNSSPVFVFYFQMLRLWESFRPLLNEAESVISHRRPSAVNAVDTMVSLMGRDLEKVLSEASSGPFLNPAQNAEEMVSKLNEMCSHGNKLYAKLKRLNTEKQNLQGKTMEKL